MTNEANNPKCPKCGHQSYLPEDTSTDNKLHRQDYLCGNPTCTEFNQPV